MVTALVELDKSDQVVFESFTLTRAALACAQPEANGLPSRLALMLAGHVILVPNENAGAPAISTCSECC
jgi:hypothetical protein